MRSWSGCEESARLFLSTTRARHGTGKRGNTHLFTTRWTDIAVETRRKEVTHDDDP
jgi:hypothetical protein